jgi:hypothetical protein
MEEKKLDKSAPWYVHAHKLEQLFLSDDDVQVGFDENAMTAKLFVRGTDKAEALEKIIAHEVECGGVTLHVVVVPDNDEEPTTEELLQRAFSGNELFSGTAVEELYGGTATYALFAPKTVQFWCDNIGSCYGIETMTAEDVARSVLNVDAFICSDLKAE